MESRVLLRRIDARLRELGLSPRAASLLATEKPDLIRDIKRRGHDIKSGNLTKLAAVLRVSPEYLLDEDAQLPQPKGSGDRTVPALYRAAAALRETTPREFEICPAAAELVPAPRDLERPEQCFAAEVVDDSAVGLKFPVGTILFLRRLEHVGVLHVGDRVLVRDRAPEGGTTELLAGTIGFSSGGDLVATTHSPSPEVPSAVIVRAAEAHGGFADRQAAFRHRDDKIRYRPEPSDRAEILGLIEKARKPGKG